MSSLYSTVLWTLLHCDTLINYTLVSMCKDRVKLYLQFTNPMSVINNIYNYNTGLSKREGRLWLFNRI